MLKRIIFTSAHLIFWAVFISLSLEVGFKVSEGWDLFLQIYPIYALHLLWAGAGVYLFYCYLSKLLLIEHKPYQHLLFSIGVSILISLFFFGLIFLLFPNVREYMDLSLWIGSTITTFLLTQIGTLLKAFVIWYNEEENKSELEKTNLRNELSMLRTQVNPHFLFNSLNNIDSMIKSHPDKASEAIIKLSDMMRYMLYETNTEYINLEKEIKYITDLVALHRLRHADKNSIQFDTDIENESQQIIPFLVLPFVENAFKFASKKRNHPLVSIKIRNTPAEFYFECSNHFMDVENSTRESGGLGLSNARRRLEAYYTNRYQLSISKNDDLYQVKLNISHND